MTLVGKMKADAVDADCEFRPCFSLGFDKGSFTPGVGYTRYHAVARPVCWTRHISGCPHKPAEEGIREKCNRCGGEGTYEGEECWFCSGHGYTTRLVLLDPNPCCDAPRVRKARAPLPWKQRCVSCGAWLKGKRLAIARGTA